MTGRGIPPAAWPVHLEVWERRERLSWRGVPLGAVQGYPSEKDLLPETGGLGVPYPVWGTPILSRGYPYLVFGYPLGVFQRYPPERSWIQRLGCTPERMWNQILEYLPPPLWTNTRLWKITRKLFSRRPLHRPNPMAGKGQRWGGGLSLPSLSCGKVCPVASWNWVLHPTSHEQRDKNEIITFKNVGGKMNDVLNNLNHN